MSIVKPDVIVISSDDEDDGRNGLESEHDADCIGFGDHKEEENDDDSCRILSSSCKSDSSNQGGNDLQELSLYECKTYLRKHGMRVSGTKDECIQRIKEHGRLKDGMGESLYPRSSFSINCTGDACKGDVVLFKQNKYNSQRKIIGIRTVAGRIANESYGASSQHTFSVEVLWSKQSEKLNPLSILLIKGRNLYRFGTYRQPWESEAERLKVLREKHERGRAARQKRKLRDTEFASGDTKGAKLKVFHRGPYQSKYTTQNDRHKHVINNTRAHNQAVWFQNVNLKRSMQLTNLSDPNSIMYSYHHPQEASMSFSYDKTSLPNNRLLPLGFPGYSHNNNEQGPNQAFSQPPDHHHHNNEPPAHRSKDKKAKSSFSKCSFTINCTGDARLGDIVLFKQHICLGTNKAGKKRTVAGRIIKVRECGSKDKQKFMIRVLWATNFLHLRRHSTLLVGSRNLYKFGTFRQPRKNEANRSKMIEEKHRPATRKRKLKKTDIDSNKNKGAKRQKVFHKGISQSKQKIQKPKHKSSKKKGASATLVKVTKAQKRKAPRPEKKKMKKAKPQTSHPNPNSNLSVSVNPNQNLNENSNSISSTTPNTRQNPNSNPNPHLVKVTKAQKRKALRPDKKKMKNAKQQTFHPNANSNLSVIVNPNQNLNQSPNSTSSTTPNTHQNPNSNPNPQAQMRKAVRLKKKMEKAKQQTFHPKPNSSPSLSASPNQNLNQNPNSISSTTPNTCQNPSPNLNPCSNPNLNLYPHPNLNPHANSYMYHDGQLQEANGRMIMPNHPPVNYLPNQPPVWFTPNPAPFGFPGYGGQWGPNHAFIQPPGYYDSNQLVALLLIALCYQQQPQ